MYKFPSPNPALITCFSSCKNSSDKLVETRLQDQLQAAARFPVFTDLVLCLQRAEDQKNH